MRNVVIDKTTLNIPSTATVVLYECDKYGNAINLNSYTIEDNITTVLVNCDTRSFKSSTSDILAQYALYMLVITVDKQTQKIPLFIFPGEGDLAISDILNPINYESIFNVMYYTGEGLPIVLQDCIEKFDAWLASPNKAIYPREYNTLITTFIKYANFISNNENYITSKCLSDFDAILSRYIKGS